MRLSCTLWLLGLSIAGSGCALVEDANRNLCVAFSSPIEVHLERARNERWAEAAWERVPLGDNHCVHSEDFARGFKDGFAEYLFRGGDGEPPLVAPKRYRHFCYQNPNGYNAIQDWFAGYRYGTAAARDSGARKWITSTSALHMGLPEAPTHGAPLQNTNFSGSTLPEAPTHAVPLQNTNFSGSTLPETPTHAAPFELPKRHPESNQGIPLSLPKDLPKEADAPAPLSPAKISLGTPPTIAKPVTLKPPKVLESSPPPLARISVEGDESPRLVPVWVVRNGTTLRVGAAPENGQAPGVEELPPPDSRKADAPAPLSPSKVSLGTPPTGAEPVAEKQPKVPETPRQPSEENSGAGDESPRFAPVWVIRNGSILRVGVAPGNGQAPVAEELPTPDSRKGIATVPPKE